MADEKTPAQQPETVVPDDATPHNPGLGPKPSDPEGVSAPDAKIPYDKKSDPAQQPT